VRFIPNLNLSRRGGWGEGVKGCSSLLKRDESENKKTIGRRGGTGETELSPKQQKRTCILTEESLLGIKRKKQRKKE